MNAKPLNFRTKTHHKTKSLTLSHQFTQIQKVLTQYQKKKFHPKIQNFHYMSTHSIAKSPKTKFRLKKDNQSFSSQKVFGPLPLAFHQSYINKKTQKSYQISQITLASSQQKQTYTKMSKIRNPQKRRRIKDIYPKSSQRYIQSINNNFIELLGKQVEYVNSISSREQIEEDEKKFAEFKKERNLYETNKSAQLESQSICKKYAQIEIDELLEQNTKLTMSQKRRITQYKKRDQELKGTPESKSTRKRQIKIYKREKPYVLINENNQEFNKLRTQIIQKKQQKEMRQNDENQFEDEEINFSSKGWIIAQNNQSNLMTL